MTLDAFKASLGRADPPGGLSAALRALWWDAKGDWAKAHAATQEDEADPVNAWVHAYLHRKEGDLKNAGGWYRRAGRPAATGPLDAEWEAIAGTLVTAAKPAD